MPEMRDSRHSGRVLIADDDPLIRRLLSKLVLREGMEVDTVADGVGALEKLANGTYDAILLDLMMPKVNGYDVVNYLKRWSARTRPIVLVITAYGDNEWRDLDPSVVTGVVRKPFEIADLGKLLRLCIERHPTESASWGTVHSLQLLRRKRSN
ncbi:MAG: response regulator [Acidobacteria bacterium]|nr:response regulator [Acidobacteriota bacterium]